MQEFCRWRATRKGDFLDERLREPKRILGFEVLQFHYPITACSSRVWFNVLVVGFAIGIVFDMADTQIVQTGQQNLRHLQLEATVGLEYKSTQNLSGELTLLRRGCVISKRRFNDFLNTTTTFFFEFVNQTEVDGFTLSVSSSLEGVSGLHFVLKSSNDKEFSWTFFGQTTDFRKVCSGVRFLDTPHDFLADPSCTRDLRAPWPLVTESLLSSGLLAMTCLLVACFGLMQRDILAKRTIAIGCCSLALNGLITALGYLLLGLPREAFLPLWDGAIFAMMAVTVILSEQRFFDRLGLLGALSLAGRVVVDAAIFRDPGYLRDSPPYKGLSLLALGAAVVARRMAGVWQAAAAVAEDRRAYDAVWAAALKAPDALNTLSAVRDALARLAAAAPPGPAVQRVWRAGPAVGGGKEAQARESGGGEARCVRSLDQVYAQAWAVAGMLEGLAREVAWAGGGQVAVGAGEDRAAGAGLLTPGLRGWVGKGLVKGPARAVEKALGCYGGDVGRLVDVCRARVAVEGLGGLRDCLRWLEAAGPGVRVEKVKARLADGPALPNVSGFRVVVVNLRFDTADTRELGVDGHVCELQLVLRSMLEALTPDRHARYLRFRAVRGLLSRFGPRRRLAEVSVWPDDSEACDEGQCGGVGRNGEAFNGDGQEKQASSGELASRHCSMRFECGCGVESEEPCGVLEMAVVASRAGRTGNGDAENVAEIEGWQQAWAVSGLRAGKANGGCWEDVNAAVLEVFVRSTLEAGDVLGAGAAKVERAVEGSSDGAVWFTSTPLAASASRPIFQLVYFLFAVFFTYSAISLWINMDQRMAFYASAIRLHVLETRGGASPDESQLGGLGLLWDGCWLSGGPAEVSIGLLNVSGWKESGLVGWTNFGRVVRANGYYFVTGKGAVEFDPVRWVLEARTDGDWSVVGASGWQMTHFGYLALYPQLDFDTTRSRGETVWLDHRASWPSVLSACSGGLEWALVMLSIIAIGRLGLGHLVRPIFVSGALLDEMLLLAVAVGFYNVGDTRATVQSWLFFVSGLVLPVGVGFFEAQIVSVFVIYGMFFWTTGTLVWVLVLRSSWTTTALNLGPSAGTASFIFGMAVLYFRQRIVRRARWLVLEDKMRYDTLWDQVSRADGATAWIRELHDLASALAHGAPGNPPRQQARVWSGEDTCPGPVLLSNGAARQGAVWEAVESLDQLYVQATCLHPILLGKVCQWAGGSRGLFTAMAEEGSDGGKEFVTLEEAAARGMRVKFAGLKAPGRAVEKLGRSYGQDVSQLVDVCRQSVVFRDGRDLVACLTAMAADADTRVLRVKNRLDLGFDANASAGYRDVGLNLCIDSLETRALGADGHVCEVQLLLLPFAEIKSNEGHRRYVTFRNLRGE